MARQAKHHIGRSEAVRARADDVRRFLEAGPSARRAMAGLATQIAALGDGYVATQRALYLDALQRCNDDDGDLDLTWLEGNTRLEPLARMLRMAFHYGALMGSVAVTNRLVHRFTGGQFKGYDPNVIMSPMPRWYGTPSRPNWMDGRTFPPVRSLSRKSTPLVPRAFNDHAAVQGFYAYVGAPVTEDPDPVEGPGGPLPRILRRPTHGKKARLAASRRTQRRDDPHRRRGGDGPHGSHRAA